MVVHDMRIIPTNHRGGDTGRVRYRVECLACKVVVHEATTAPVIRVQEHFNGDEGYERPMTADEIHVCGERSLPLPRSS